MSGHSKWANIRHKKDRADAKRGKIFSRIAKEIISAVKVGGADAKANPRLRLAIQKARAANMPNDNVERNIKKASSVDQADFVEQTYEVYGHGGVGIIVDVVTDNKNRAASDLRIATNKRGGSVASPGSVAFNFDRKGVIQIPKGDRDEDEVFGLVTDAGAEDFDVEEDMFMVITDPADLYAVKEKLDEAGLESKEANLEMIPKSLVEVDKETAESNQALIDWLEDLDDVDRVVHNMDVVD